jgi:hypothetical protein
MTTNVLLQKKKMTDYLLTALSHIVLRNREAATCFPDDFPEEAIDEMERRYGDAINDYLEEHCTNMADGSVRLYLASTPHLLASTSSCLFLRLILRWCMASSQPSTLPT